MTSRELVFNTLAYKNSGRVPRQLWTLPWAAEHHKEQLEEIQREFPDDIVTVYAALQTPLVKEKGDPYAVGESVDMWGCVFDNINPGAVGEVKRPLVTGDEWEDVANVHIPEELLSFDIEEANRNVETVRDKFTLAGAAPRPFEQLQFIRGTENLYVDLMFKPTKMMEFIEKMHDFYCRVMRKWAQVNVDAFFILDDWGSQNSLLINPVVWDEIFKPLYRDYINIAKQSGKKIFMHSDGNTLSIIPKLIDLGLDAINTQIFCIGVENLKQYKGEITFWGEIDRQHLLSYGTQEDVKKAVELVKDTLWDNGGCFAQCEFGAGANPANVRQVFEEWDRLTR